MALQSGPERGTIKMYMKLKKIRYAIVVFALALVTACASAPPIQLTKEESAVIDKLDVFIAHPQTVLTYQMDHAAASSGAVGFGLLGAAIGAAVDSGRNISWRRYSVGLIDAVSDYDYVSEFEQNLKQALDKKGFQVSPNNLAKGFDISKESALFELVREADSDAVLVVGYHYALERGYNLRAYFSAQLYLGSQFSSVERAKPYVKKMNNVLATTRTPASSDALVVATALLEDDAKQVKDALAKLSKDVAGQASHLFMR